ncbi:Non-structural maintenance of chromosomes element 3-like protein [Frankliniella fusca]|uniref:Non-structural maintenance of chromosomes element 3-like protein n=1 Tax=Frankliniella fusca TaxID=407009 RepID=A0AAE1HU94_9NEOP|nr:Non-structural maintenance of chromosomes element 3-like protein [Frankliniella fusca]
MSQASQGTPRSMTQSQTVGSSELKELARSAVRYLLTNDYDKVPIKHSDIVKNLTKNTSKNTQQVLSLAGKMLKDVYGIKLIEDTSKATKQYLLINCMKHQEHIAVAPITQAEMTLLAIILAIIFMQTSGRWRDCGIEQSKVHNFLQLLQIDPTDIHDHFGDVKKVLETFKSQKYLDIVKIENTDPPKFEYRWGMRAIEEVSPRAILQFATELYGREKIESWAAQYKAVVEFEAQTQRGG